MSHAMSHVVAGVTPKSYIGLQCHDLSDHDLLGKGVVEVEIPQVEALRFPISDDHTLACEADDRLVLFELVNTVPPLRGS